MKYKCSYTSGGGTEYYDGFWELKKTPKTTTLTKVEEHMGGIFSMHKVGEKIKVGAGTGNPLRDHEDGTFTVYFNQAGTPYYFEPTVEIPIIGEIKDEKITYFKNA